MLQQRSEKKDESTSANEEESTSANEMNNPVSKTINMKLLKSEIERFSGDPKE